MTPKIIAKVRASVNPPPPSIASCFPPQRLVSLIPNLCTLVVCDNDSKPFLRLDHITLMSVQVVGYDLGDEPVASSASQARPKKRARANGPKRAPYVAAACDFCHGRKLKCSGDRPCSRCQKNHVSCSYPIETVPDGQREALETPFVTAPDHPHNL